MVKYRKKLIEEKQDIIAVLHVQEIITLFESKHITISRELMRNQFSKGYIVTTKQNVLFQITTIGFDSCLKKIYDNLTFSFSLARMLFILNMCLRDIFMQIKKSINR